MKTETKMIILRMLATYYVPEYRYFKRYHFHIDGFKLKACELAETMASEGMTRRKIAETFNIGLRTAKR